VSSVIPSDDYATNFLGFAPEILGERGQRGSTISDDKYNIGILSVGTVGVPGLWLGDLDARRDPAPPEGFGLFNRGVDILLQAEIGTDYSAPPGVGHLLLTVLLRVLRWTWAFLFHLTV
jgi:hypothetical protein